jgi:hypothetical protein
MKNPFPQTGVSPEVRGREDVEQILCVWSVLQRDLEPRLHWASVEQFYSGEGHEGEDNFMPFSPISMAGVYVQVVPLLFLELLRFCLAVSQGLGLRLQVQRAARGDSMQHTCSSLQRIGT